MATYQTLKEQIKNRETKKLANKTYIVRVGDALAIRLHNTDILTFHPDGNIIVTSGGWKTVTTKARIKEYLGGPCSISQERGLWYWYWNGEKKAIFKDGDVISPTGVVRDPTSLETGVVQSKLRKQIDGYAKLCASKIPLDKPGGGDCLYCQGEAGLQPQCSFMDIDSKGKTTPMNFKTKGDHLESHMKEKYVVPSLVYNALKEGNASQVAWWSAFKGENGETIYAGRDLVGYQIRRAINRYMKRRFGLPV